MGFFKRLFTGDICPIDNIVRKTPNTKTPCIR